MQTPEVTPEVLYAAFFEVLRDPESRWMETEAWEFIRQVADECGIILALKELGK